MEPIDHFNLRNFDLNLLVAFDVLMLELSVTRAAARLKLQQPAMSHALATLRTLFDDVLFIRTGHTMEATPRAKALYQAIHPILLQTQQALSADVQFDPATEERTFRLGINGQLEAMLSPALMAHISAHAPGIRIQSVPIGELSIVALLNDNHVDLAIAHSTEGLSWHRREQLYREQYACCFNPALFEFSAPITAADYFNARHGVVSASINLHGFIAYLLQHAASAHRFQLAMSSHNVMTLLATAAKAPVIATLHRRVAAHYAPLFGLATSAIPFKVDDLEIDMIWHPRSDNDPALDWLRGLIRSSAPRCPEKDAA
ncbi:MULTISPECIES: LysR family transcriptional regulator [unclassified Janthinobacterium]|uniref:LysR family transcriptional regulator n=1 Tax=unclassified Janthinobacterium TaxID=2610881 RepID=UPI0016222142|nr:MULTISPECIES: LysR family transcriptional regulator [unclassified Janthinobacterium]MBB5606389.1 DNA-binding transcriptional LysR family regulator [Janthinobacterium sp. S3T4]MBB5611739.1 DNA-binding transcriptional LysR family regulator [Janthinobacterium sp. S3M3]